MDPTDLEQERRRDRLRAWIAEHGGHAAVVAERRLSPSQGSFISQIVNGYSFGPRAARRMEQRLGMVAGWLDDGRPIGWQYTQHPVAGEAPARWQVAQDLSQGTVSHALPMLSWETLVMDQLLPDIFRTLLPDGALAPDYPAGAEIVWSTRRRAEPGRLVLVRDSHGQVHARQCRQGRAPGRWIAAPLNAAFLAFEDAEVTLLAVFKGMLEPDDT